MKNTLRTLRNPVAERVPGETADALNAVLEIALARRDYETSARVRGQLQRLARTRSGCKSISPTVKKRSTRGGAACPRSKLHAPPVKGTE